MSKKIKKFSAPIMIRLTERDRALLELKSSTDNTSMSDIARDFIKIGLSTVYPDQYSVLPKIDTQVSEK